MQNEGPQPLVPALVYHAMQAPGSDQSLMYPSLRRYMMTASLACRVSAAALPPLIPGNGDFLGPAAPMPKGANNE